MLITAVQQSDSIVHIYTLVFNFYLFIFLEQNLFFYYFLTFTFIGMICIFIITSSRDCNVMKIVIISISNKYIWFCTSLYPQGSEQYL